MNTVTVNVPTSLASKRLSITEYSDGRRKVAISSNLLPLFGFEKGTPVVERSLGEGQGYTVELAENQPSIFRTKKIYSRQYKQRKNNPFETLFETSSKKILDESLGRFVKNVHVTITHGRMIFKGIIDRVAERLHKLKLESNPLTVFSACTSGMDAFAAVKAGFQINSVLEWRPNERRDKTDLTETGVISALANLKTKHVFNEDIYEVSPAYIEHVTKNAPSTCFTVSLQCDDDTQVKANSLKEKSIEDLSTVIDMALPVLNLIDKLRFPVVLLEQVKGFAKSHAARLWDVRMRRMGYTTHTAILDARDHDGVTSRERFFSLATLLPSSFEFPAPTPRNETPLFETIVGDLTRYRDITENSSMQKGLEIGRLRCIKSDSTHAPTLLKSQSRMAKDSCVIKTDDNRILFPDEQLMRDLMGVPEDFNTTCVGSVIASEILGQGVDMPLYEKLMQNVKEHVMRFLNANTNTQAQVA
ncbi:DNA cytosine methyltransferase [Vibrio breoganii]